MRLSIPSMVAFQTFILGLLLSTNTYACGGGWYDEGYYYFNLFDQENISESAYYPFLRIDEETFYTPEDQPEFDKKGNVLLWQKVLKNWSTKEIYDYIYTYNSNKKLSNQAAENYLSISKKIATSLELKNQSSWSYQQILKDHKVDYIGHLEVLNKGFNQTSGQIKQRYGFQIIRLLHYSRQFEDALAFFDQHLSANPKNEIHYYTVDQVAGCHYGLKDYATASLLFQKVFINSLDRKKSAYLSHLHCSRFIDPSTVVKTSEEKVNLAFIKSMSSFGDKNKELNNLISLDANSPKVELLAMRMMNEIERSFVTSQSVEKTATNHQSIDRLVTNIDRVLNTSNIVNKDFWSLLKSYAYFQKRDFNTATSILESVNNSTYQKQKNTLQHAYRIASWNSIGATEEIYLLELVKDKSLSSIFQAYLKHQVSLKYYQTGKLAKAFLNLNSLESIVGKNLFSKELIDDLIDFYSNPKNDYEKHLAHTSYNTDSKAIDFIRLVEGNYYMIHKDEQNAVTAYRKSNLVNSNITFLNVDIHSSVNHFIFSNGTTEGFDFAPDDILKDSVFLSDNFSFIKKEMTRLELAQTIVRLKEMTNDEKVWKQKLAHYLLGNYYYNISNTGFFKHLYTANYSNCCYGTYFENRWKEGANTTTEESIQKNKDLNPYKYFYASMYNNTVDASKKHFESAMKLSTDDELNARITFMLAKCSLNEYYNQKEPSTSSLFSEKDKSSPSTSYFNYFKTLNTRYKHTNFSKKARHECSYFGNYSNL